MMNYLKLVDFEVKRFGKIYAVLIALLVILQPVAMLISLSGVEDSLKGFDQIDGMPMNQYTQSLLFVLPSILCIGALVFYVFGTWYLEWFGKNTFAYQILLLPGNRMSVYFAKLTSLLLFIAGCLVAQLAIFPLLKAIYASRIPIEYRVNDSLMSWIAQHQFILDVVIPVNGLNFLIHYSLGIMAVIILFTMIVLERSFRLKGIGLSILYGIGCVFLFIIADLFEALFFSLYPNEYITIKVICMAFTIGLSLWISNYAINKKISV